MVMKDKWWMIQDPQKIQEARIANNNQKKKLLKKKLYIFDQDGTIYINFHLIEGAKDLIEFLNKKDKKIVFISNNSSISTSTYKKNLTELLKMEITKDHIYNSTLATTQYLKSKNISKVYALGTKDFIDEICSYDIKIDDKKPEMIVVAFDTTLTYDKLKKACLFIRSGIEYIATHPDKVCPTKEGFIPDTGSFISLIETATDVKPKDIIGKPNPNLINFLLEKMNLKPQEAIIFGDRLYTDIKMGKHCNLTTALVLSGESKIKDIKKYEIEPDFVFTNLKEAYNLLKK